MSIISQTSVPLNPTTVNASWMYPSAYQTYTYVSGINPPVAIEQISQWVSEIKYNQRKYDEFELLDVVLTMASTIQQLQTKIEDLEGALFDHIDDGSDLYDESN